MSCRRGYGRTIQRASPPRPKHVMSQEQRTRVRRDARAESQATEAYSQARKARNTRRGSSAATGPATGWSFHCKRGGVYVNGPLLHSFLRVPLMNATLSNMMDLALEVERKARFSSNLLISPG